MEDHDRLGKANIEEVSKRANVSKSTVSKALNNCAGVSADVKLRVLQVAYEMQYEPLQKQRRTKKSGVGTVGVVMPINPYYFWNTAVQGMKSQERPDEGFHVVFSLFAGMDSQDDVLYCLDYMQDLQVDVLVVTPPPNERVAHKLREIARKIPLVFFNERANVPSLFYAGTNFYQDGIRLARACQNTLQDHPGVLRIVGMPLPMVTQRDEAFRREVMYLLPDIHWVGEVHIETLKPSLLSAQLARLLDQKYRGRFQSVYVSQGFMPQVC